jgi:hypothetical protein
MGGSGVSFEEGVEARFVEGGEPTPIGAEASGIVILVERGEEEEEETGKTRWGLTCGAHVHLSSSSTCGANSALQMKPTSQFKCC